MHASTCSDCQGNVTQRTPLLVYRTVATFKTRPLHAYPQQDTTVPRLTRLAPVRLLHFFHLATTLDLTCGLVRVWDTVGEDQTLKGEYKVISGRMCDTFIHLRALRTHVPAPLGPAATTSNGTAKVNASSPSAMGKTSV